MMFLCIANYSVAAKGNKNNDEIPKADLKVSYDYHHISEMVGGSVREKNYDMLLLANPTYSKFFSPKSEYIDSLESTPSGRRLLNQMTDAAVIEYAKTKNRDVFPAYQGRMYVFKSANDSVVTVYDNYDLDAVAYYSEPLSDMRWVIGDSTKVILGYECIMATTDYHGRHWTVWFTPDIPLQDGPWKLCGLPGLILEASEGEGVHSFTANGIEASSQTIYPIYNKDRYEKMDRRKMLRAYRSYLEKGMTHINTMLQSFSGDNPVEIKADTLKGSNGTVDFLETDYR